MSQNPPFDASIPVLTEVFSDHAERPERAEPVPAGSSLEARAQSDWSAAEWAEMERRLCERILHQLQGRVDFVLEQRLRDSMEEALKHALSGLTSEIRQGLQQTIEKIVVRAVAQELAHLQTLK